MPDISTYIIETRKKPMVDRIVAHCYVLGLKASSVTGEHCAVHACAKKVAMGSAYTLKQFNAYTWLCDVDHSKAAP